MRICLFSKYGQSSNLLYSGARKGLEDNKIAYIDIDVNLERNEPSPYWTSIPTLSRNKTKKVDQKILEKIGKFKPDIIILLQYDSLQFVLDNGERLREILKKKGRIAFWLVDLALKINANKDLGQYIDCLFLSNKDQLEEYKNKWGIKNAYFMPQGCFATDSSKKIARKKYLLGFLGRRQRNDPRYKERNLILDSFKDKFGLRESNKVLSVKDAADFYQECKIIIGASWKNNVYLYSSDRIFNVLGSRGFYLCSYFSGIEKLFRNHQHLVWFTSIQEGLELAKHYLEENLKREKISYSGYMLAKAKHTYKRRLANIINILQNKSRRFEGFYEDSNDLLK